MAYRPSCSVKAPSVTVCSSRSGLKFESRALVSHCASVVKDSRLLCAILRHYPGLSAEGKTKVYSMKNTAEVSPGKAPMKKVLCAGDDIRLLSIRCEVLNRSGYSAQISTVADAAGLIKKEAFDLIIVAAFLSEADQQRVLSAAGDTPTIVLQGIAVAPELLAAVEALIPAAG